MNNEFLDYLRLYNKKDIKGLEFLLNKFEPLLKKYAYKLYDYKDGKSDLTLYFIKLINNIVDNKILFKEDKYFISYINISIKREYISLLKKEEKVLHKDYYEILDCENKLEEKTDLFFYDLINNLNVKEQNVLKLKFIDNYTNSEIARKMNLSRQNIQICLKRSIAKLRKDLN